MESTDQTTDLNAIFCTHFTLKESKLISSNEIVETLNININPSNETTPDFSKMATSDDGVFAMEDDYEVLSRTTMLSSLDFTGE